MKATLSHSPTMEFIIPVIPSLAQATRLPPPRWGAGRSNIQAVPAAARTQHCHRPAWPPTPEASWQSCSSCSPPPHVHNWQCPSASPSSLPQSSGRGNPTSQLWSPPLHPRGTHSHPGDVPPTLPPPGPTPHNVFTTRRHPTQNGIQNPTSPFPRPSNPPLSCSHRGGGAGASRHAAGFLHSVSHGLGMHLDPANPFPTSLCTA